MGGDVVIAVNLNGDLIGRHFVHGSTEEISDEESERELARDRRQGQPDCALGGQDEGAGFGVRLDSHFAAPQASLTPGCSTIAGSIDIMQDRTRSRMSGEPPMTS